MEDVEGVKVSHGEAELREDVEDVVFVPRDGGAAAPRGYAVVEGPLVAVLLDDAEVSSIGGATRVYEVGDVEMTRDEAEHLDLVLGVEEVLACHRLAVQEEGLHHERLAIRLATDQGDASERALAEVRDVLVLVVWWIFGAARVAAHRGAAPRERSRARRPRQGRARVTVKEKEDDTSEIFLSKLREAKRRIRKKTGGRVQTPACEGVDRSRARVPFLTLGAIGPRLRRRARTRVRSGVDLFPRMVGAVASTAEARERLCARWPGRREQINKLLGLLGEPHDHALPVFVHGPHVTGKSSIVRDVFTTLGRPFAYTSLVDSHTPRLLLDAILEELQPHLEGLTEKHTRCDRLADLVSLLAKGLPADGPAVYLVIDEATRLLDWKGTDHLLPALMKLSELTGAPHDRLRHARSNPIPLDDDAGRLPSPDVSPRLPSLALDSSANYPTPPTRRSKRRHDPRGEARMG